MGLLTLTIFPVLAVLLMNSSAYAAPGSRCPPPERVYVYSKREECHSDSQCSGSKICCPTPSRMRSCVEPAFGTDYSDYNDKYNSYKIKTTATGTYCGNKKCSPYEKCVNDGRGRFICRRS